MCFNVHINNPLRGCVVHVAYCESKLIIPLQTASRAPAVALGLQLHLFHLKDRICPETQTLRVTSHKVNLRGEEGRERRGGAYC